MASKAPEPPKKQKKGANKINYKAELDDSVKGKAKHEEVFMEVSRADLVAQFVGQTAPKVTGTVAKAKGGVLFIDEAYSLKKDKGDSFGQEAVDTLIKEIEDNRDQVIAIFAGYEHEMQKFFDTNPGFKSRVPFTFYFDDYACDELMSIADIQLKSKDFVADSDAKLWVERNVRAQTGCCDKGVECHPRRDNGNGRSVRNVLEGAYRNFAARIAPTVYQGVQKEILDNAVLVNKEKVAMIPDYKRKHGLKWKERLERDYGYGKYCGDAREAQCNAIKEQLKTLTAWDTSLVVAAVIAEQMNVPCQEVHMSTDELEDLARKKLQGATKEQWAEISEALRDGDCQNMRAVLSAVSSTTAPLSATAMDIMAEDADVAPVLDKLNELEGLAKVKETMGQLYGTARIAKWRTLLQMKSTSGQSFHMRFLGNPGTGKTVVARIVGEMLVRMGVVAEPKRGKMTDAEKIIKSAEKKKSKEEEKQQDLELRFKEVARPDMVAQHSGQTAPKVKALVASAEGGVLFIDEAYSIVRRSGDSFGKEAVDTLIKEMEDKRATIVVILAGYDAEMEKFFESNPGFKSRVPITFHFQDYDCATLEKIGQIRFNKMGIHPETAASGHVSVKDVLSFASGCCEDLLAPDCVTTRDNGNGRTVRNVVEAMSQAMARRVMKEHPSGSSISKEDLENLYAQDVEHVALQQAELRLGTVCKHNGMLQDLIEALSLDNPTGLTQWFKQWKLADPVSQIYKFIREFGRVSILKSAQLSELQQQCGQGLEALMAALRAKGEAVCGAKGLLQEMDKKLTDKSSKMAFGDFNLFVQQVEHATAEAVSIKKFFSSDEELPSPLDTLESLDSTCGTGVSKLMSRSLPVKLKNLMGTGGVEEDCSQQAESRVELENN